MILLHETIEKIPNYFLPEEASGFSADILVHIAGEGGGTWTVQIKDQKCVILENETTSPDFEISAEAEDCIKILQGELNPAQAYMNGKIDFRGNFFRLTALSKMFRIPDSLKGIV